jgi:glucose uptake protein GlcU
MFGFLAAAGSALAWGSYIVPFKKSPSSNIALFQTMMTIGVFLFALIVSPLIGYPLSLNIYGIAGGILWGIGNMLSLKAVSELGISLAMPVWVSVVVIGSFLYGILLFHELPSGILLGLFGVVFIIFGVIFIGTTGKSERKNIRQGITAAVIAGICFASQLVPLKIAKLTSAEFFFPMSVGILLFGVGFALYKKVKFTNEAIGKSLLCGGMWSVGNLLSIIAVSILGLAKGLPLTQSAVLIAVLWGLFYFKEITKSSEVKKVIVGSIILLSGVIILGLA